MGLISSNGFFVPVYVRTNATTANRTDVYAVMARSVAVSNAGAGASFTVEYRAAGQSQDRVDPQFQQRMHDNVKRVLERRRDSPSSARWPERPSLHCRFAYSESNSWTLSTLAAPTIRGRIDQLRRAMARHGVSAVIVPSSDPHLSEYLPERWKGREWLSGFTGSVGTLVVTRDSAGVWVDSRYWTQAEVQLAGTGIDLMKLARVGSLGARRVAGEQAEIRRCGRGRRQHAGTRESRAPLKPQLAPRGVRLRTDLDLLAEIWPDRASLPIPPIYEHVAPHAVTRAPPSWHGCATKCSAPVRLITSCPHSTTSPGSPICAAPMSATTRCSSPIC